MNHSCSLFVRSVESVTFQDAIARTHDPNLSHQLSVADLWVTSCVFVFALSYPPSPPPSLSSGVVRVSLADMDRETRENYTVAIQAKDMGGQLGGLAGTTTVNITLGDINDNPPMFDQSKRRTNSSSLLHNCPIILFSLFLWFTLLPLYLNPHHLPLIPPDTLTADKRS